MGRKPKLRRRGNRLIAVYDDGRSETRVADHNMREWRVTEFRELDYWFRVAAVSSDKKLYHLIGEITGGSMPKGPTQQVVRDWVHGPPVAVRGDDSDVWQFRLDDKKGFDWVPATSAVGGIPNIALVAGLVKRELPDNLARFLHVDRHLCNIDDILAVLNDSRFSLIRNFHFRTWVPDKPIDTDRRVENTLRHEGSNWDEMLKAGGGLLHPETYDIARRGADLLVLSRLKTG